MNVLLDTATFLWVCLDSPELSKEARRIFVSPANELYLSSVSAWEIAIKHSIGHLPLPQPPDRFIPAQREKHGIESLPLDEESSLHLALLPKLHRDPFDRMLVCQALVHGLVILTSDPLITAYPVRSVW